MPSLKNLARIKDTTTGKYLKSVGFQQYTWRTSGYFLDIYQRRNNSWAPVGTAYKKGHVGRILESAAVTLAWVKARDEGRIPKELESYEYGWPRERLEEWQAARREFARQIESEAVIPDTWVVEEFVVTATGGGETPAKDWK